MEMIKSILLKTKSLLGKISDFSIGRNKKITYSLLTVFLLVGSFAAYKYAQAGYVASALGEIIMYMASAAGNLTIWLAKAVGAVAKFNDFTTLTSIRTSWQIIRDVCNLFFILILLVIAVSTILNIERYSYKKALPKLLLMIILINFSLLICGVLIDISQVITISFVDAWGQGGNNLINMFKLPQVYSAKEAENMNVTVASTVIALIIGLILIIVSLVVTLVIIFVFLLRAVAFWILIILSPAAFLAGASSFGEKYYQQWWAEFTKYLIVGPVLAFFLWVSMVLATQSINIKFEGTAVETTTSGGTYTQIADPKNLVGFILSVCMLIGALVAAQKLGVAGAGMAGKGLGFLKKMPGAVVGAAATYTGAKAVYQGVKEALVKPGEAKREALKEKVARGSAEKISAAKKRIGAIASPKLRKELEIKKDQAELSKLGSKKAELRNFKNMEDFAILQERTKGYDRKALEANEKAGVAGAKDKLDELNKFDAAKSALKKANIPELKGKDLDQLEGGEMISIFNEKARKSKLSATPINDQIADVEKQEAVVKKRIATSEQDLEKIGPPGRIRRFLGIDEAGKYEDQFVGGYRASKVKGKRDDMKAMDDDDVERKINDSDHYTSTAAIIEHVSRGNASDGEIEDYRNRIREAHAGDKGVLSVFEAEVNKHNQSASLKYRKENPDELSDKVMRAVSKGILKMKDSSTDSIVNNIEEYHSGSASTKDFAKQVSDLAPEQKKQVKQGVRDKTARLREMYKAETDTSKKAEIEKRFNNLLKAKISLDATFDVEDIKGDKVANYSSTDRVAFIKDFLAAKDDEGKLKYNNIDPDNLADILSKDVIDKNSDILGVLTRDMFMKLIDKAKPEQMDVIRKNIDKLNESVKKSLPNMPILQGVPLNKKIILTSK